MFVIFQFNNACRLHDGGFTNSTMDGEPATPSWHNWMEQTEDYRITVDMKYSGK